MSRKFTSYEVIVKDADGKVVDQYDNVLKNPVKRVFGQMYVQYKFGGVTGMYERSTIAINEGYVTTRDDGWTIRIVTEHSRSYI